MLIESLDELETSGEPNREYIEKYIKPGNTIRFGKYDGKAVEWRILHVWKHEKKALLITEKAVCRKAYNAELEPITWENCTLRKWLNTEFIEALNLRESEKARILPVLNRNDDNPGWGTPGGNATWDMMFLLSIKQAERHFKDDSERICTEADSQEAVWWWLRSPGRSAYSAVGVNSDGSLTEYGDGVGIDFGCVRPAFYLNLES